MFDWLPGFITWLGEQFSSILAALNPINLIISIASSVAAILPAPSPELQLIVDTGVSAVDAVVEWISLLDYFVNLPVLLTVLGIMLAVWVGFGVVRGWRLLRSFIT